MSICVDVILAAPAGSEKVNEKVCAGLLPPVGVTETRVGGWGAVTVQVPRCTQPLSAVESCTIMYVFLAPAKEGAKVIAKLSIRTLPAIDDEEAPTLTLHWLFCNVT